MASADATPRLGRRFTAIVILVVVMPLALVSLWTTRSAARSGRALLQSQTEAQVDQFAADLARRWQLRRSDLMLIAENEPVRELLLRTAGVDSTERPPAFVVRAFAQMPGFTRVEIRDRGGRTRLRLEREASSSDAQRSAAEGDTRSMTVRLPVTDVMTGNAIGSVEGLVRVASLLPQLSSEPSTNGFVLGAFVRDGAALLPPTVDGRLFGDESFEWSAHHWLTSRRTLAEPAVELVAAGALDPYVGPFQRNARSAAIALLAAAVVAAIVMVVITRSMTSAVERELAQREALATVGEFASELAHEVRNPLTSMRLDLQRVDEVAEEPTAVRTIGTRVLRQVERLDRAVTGALRVARSGSVERKAVRLDEVLESARRAATAEFEHRRAALIVDPAAVEVEGDGGALEQLFLNLLINAAQALPVDGNGEARVSTDARASDVIVTIRDNGAGMTAGQLRRVHQPYQSSKRDGTGLGLKIARSIAASHRGTIELASDIGIGTTVTVTLPRLQQKLTSDRQTANDTTRSFT